MTKQAHATSSDRVDKRRLRRTGRTAYFAARINPRIAELVRDAAARSGLTIGEVVERAFEIYLGQEGRIVQEVRPKDAGEDALDIARARDRGNLRQLTSTRVRGIVEALLQTDQMRDAVEFIDSVSKDPRLLNELDESLLDPIISDLLCIGEKHLLTLLMKAAAQRQSLQVSMAQAVCAHAGRALEVRREHVQ